MDLVLSKEVQRQQNPSEHDHEVNHPLPINKLIAASETRKMHYL